MLSKIKKSFLVFFILLFTVISVATPYSFAQSRAAEGQGQWWFPTYNSFLDKVNQAPPNEIFGERYTHAQVSWIILSLLNIIVGPLASCADSPDFGTCMEAALNANADPGALLPLAALNDSLLSTKPASSIDYVASKMERFGIVNQAYAQDAEEAGYGFANSLAIVQEIWTISRDAAYSLVILMILILGFMVMFRAQLGAKTAVTIQSALPRVIIGLILITFSYAIAGLLVDLTFVAQGILSGIVAASDLTSSDAVSIFTGQNSTTHTVFMLMFAYIVALFGIIFASAGSGGAIAVYFGGPAVKVMAGIAIIIILVVVIVALIALIRLFWIMLKTYVTIIMLVAISPFVFLYGIVKDGVNGMWFKNMIGNLSVFFSVGAMLLLANILLFATSPEGDYIFTSFFNWVASFGGINPYNIETGVIQGRGGSMPGFADFAGMAQIGTLVSFALFVSTPNFAKGVKDYIMTGKGSFQRASAGEALGPVAGAAAFAGGAIGGASSKYLQTKIGARLANRFGGSPTETSQVTKEEAVGSAGAPPKSGRGKSLTERINNVGN